MQRYLVFTSSPVGVQLFILPYVQFISRWVSNILMLYIAHQKCPSMLSGHLPNVSFQISLYIPNRFIPSTLRLTTNVANAILSSATSKFQISMLSCSHFQLTLSVNIIWNTCGDCFCYFDSSARYRWPIASSLIKNFQLQNHNVFAMDTIF